MAPLFRSPPVVGVTGISSQSSARQLQSMVAAGTNIAWVTGSKTAVPEEFQALFSADLHEAMQRSSPDVVLMFDDPLEVCSRAQYAISAGVRRFVIVSEYVPVHDMLALKRVAQENSALVIGPNSTGLLIPGIVKAGYFSEDVCIPGRIGVLAKSGSLAYAVLAELRSHGLGISGVVSTGGDLVKGATFRDLIPFFEEDGSTDAIVVLGEIGGSDEENAAEYIARHVSKPVIAFLSGSTVKPGAAVGHAGAIVRNGVGGYEEKAATLRAAGVSVADQFGELVPKIRDSIQSLIGAR